MRHGQEVLVIDLDAQANLTLALGKEPGRLRVAITDVVFDSASLLSVSRETDLPGLDLVPSNQGMDLAEQFLPVRKNYETILLRALQGASNISPSYPANSQYGQMVSSPCSVLDAYDFIIMDCPPFMGAVTINALNAADALIIPTQPEYFSAHALRTMLETIRQVRAGHNPNLTYRILITMYDRRNRIHKEMHGQIHQTFTESVFKTTISVDTKLRESAVEGLPITHFKRRSRGAQQYDALAQEIIEYVRKSEPVETI